MELWDKCDVADSLLMVKNKGNERLLDRLTRAERFEQWMEDFVARFDEHGDPIDD